MIGIEREETIDSVRFVIFYNNSQKNSKKVWIVSIIYDIKLKEALIFEFVNSFLNEIIGYSDEFLYKTIINEIKNLKRKLGLDYKIDDTEIYKKVKTFYEELKILLEEITLLATIKT